MLATVVVFQLSVDVAVLIVLTGVAAAAVGVQPIQLDVATDALDGDIEF